MHTSARHCRRLGSQNGFTLVEAMVTLAVAAILLAWAVPSMQSFISRNQMSTEVNNFMASLYFGRSEAVKRLRDVSLCPSTDGNSCADSMDWAQGWMMYVDVNDNNNFDTGDIVVQTNPAVPLGNTGNVQRITFNPRGSSNAGSFDFTDSSGIAGARCVTLSSAGRAYANLGSCT